MINLIALVTIVLYGAASGMLFRYTYLNRTTNLPIGLAWFAVLMQIFYFASNYQQNLGFNFGFFNTGALVAMIVALLLLLASLNKPVEKLGVAVFPIAAIMLLLEAIWGKQTARFPNYGLAMDAHILTSIIAFSLLNIAALQAIMLAIQDKQIRSHTQRPFIRSLPSLQAMESLLFQMLTTGLVFLTVSLATGVIFIEDLFAQHLVHKTVLSLLAWLIFSGLLMGRKQYGWRGKTAIKWTLAGFVLLMLAYFGSKLVLELILHR